MKTAIIANSCPFAYELYQKILSKGGNVSFFDLALNSNQKVSIDFEGVFWNDEKLSSFDAAFISGFSYENPVLPSENKRDWSLWNTSHLIDQQKHSFCYSLLSRLNDCGVKLFNPIKTYVSAFDKSSQLLQISKLGFYVPCTVLTNEEKTALEFMNQHKMVIWQPTTGKALWQRFTNKQKKALIDSSKPPVMLASVAEGVLVRAYVFDGKLVAAFSCYAPEVDVFEELENFRLFELNKEEEETILNAAKNLNISWGCITVVTTKNAPVFYDFDVAPVLSDLPLKISDFILNFIASEFAQKPLTQSENLNKNDIYRRQTLLLRRMIQVQFDMEASKYREEQEQA